MKTNLFTFCIIISFLFISCGTSSITREPINPNNLPEQELVTVVIHENLFIQKFDNEEVDWPKTDFWRGSIPLNIKIPSGMHTFHVKYSDGRLYTNTYTEISAQMESGNTYLVIGEVEEHKVHHSLPYKKHRVVYNIYKYNDKKMGDKVTYNPLNNLTALDPDKLIGKLFVGSDEKGAYKLIMNQNGTFEYTKYGNIFNGTWSFNNDEKMYPFTFQWHENDRQQKYISYFLGNETFLLWGGQWVGTNVYIPFMIKFNIE